MRGLGEASVEAAMGTQNDHATVKAWKASSDYIEGPRAFAQKRKPEWKGR